MRKHLSLGIIGSSNLTDFPEALSLDLGKGSAFFNRLDDDYVDISVWSKRSDGLKRRESLRAVHILTGAGDINPPKH